MQHWGQNMAIMGCFFYAGSLRSHSRNEAYYAKMAKHKDVIIQTGEIISSARSRLSYFRGGADYANNRQKYGR